MSNLTSMPSNFTDMIFGKLGDPDAVDAAAVYALCGLVERLVKAYCRLTDIPEDSDLWFPIMEMVVDRYRARRYGSADVPQTVSSVSEGDVTINLKAAVLNSTAELTEQEKSMLRPWRKLWP